MLKNLNPNFYILQVPNFLLILYDRITSNGLCQLYTIRGVTGFDSM